MLVPTNGLLMTQVRYASLAPGKCRTRFQVYLVSTKVTMALPTATPKLAMLHWVLPRWRVYFAYLDMMWGVSLRCAAPKLRWDAIRGAQLYCATHRCHACTPPFNAAAKALA